MSDKPLVVIENVKKYYPVKAGLFSRKRLFLKAVDGVDLSIHQGEILGLVGESGCGKSTLGRLVLCLEETTGGRILFEGKDMSSHKEKVLRLLRRSMQMIFQDPYASLNPRKAAGVIIEEPLIIHRLGDRKWRRARVASLMTEVGLHPDQTDRYPHEFSGGQRQRIGIARALALQPRFIVADEPISALDVSVQAQIVNLLVALQERFHLTYLFIAHDLSVIRHVSDRIAVMYLGRIMEVVEKHSFAVPPQHPYTEALLAAAPVVAPGERPASHCGARAGRRRKTLLEGEIPSAVTLPSGCVFRTRCPYAQPICAEEIPPLKDVAPEHKIACHFWENRR